MEKETTNQVIKPLGDYVLFKNILKDKMVEIEKVSITLPPKEKENYIKAHHKEIFEEIEIISVGDECKYLKKGDLAISNPELLSRCFNIEFGEFILARESAFIGVKVKL
jgi:hypothetical protein